MLIMNKTVRYVTRERAQLTSRGTRLLLLTSQIAMSSPPYWRNTTDALACMRDLSCGGSNLTSRRHPGQWQKKNKKIKISNGYHTAHGLPKGRLNSNVRRLRRVCTSWIRHLPRCGLERTDFRTTRGNGWEDNCCRNFSTVDITSRKNHPPCTLKTTCQTSDLSSCHT